MSKKELTEKEKHELQKKLEQVAITVLIISCLEWIKVKWKESHYSTKFIILFVGICIIVFGVFDLYESIYGSLILLLGTTFYGYIRHFGSNRKKKDHYRTSFYKTTKLSNYQIRYFEILYLILIISVLSH